MRVFVDSSALYAVLDEDDIHHRSAGQWLRRARKVGAELFTHNYVVVESTALVRQRLGAIGAKRLLQDLVQRLDVMFVSRGLHRAAEAAYMASGFGPASFVDRVSFELMRDEGVVQAFAFDRHFEAEGFSLVAHADED